jgi:hypothetical protein
MDILVLATMKDAANCDNQCELQNSVKHQVAERKRRFSGSPESRLVSAFHKFLRPVPSLSNSEFSFYRVKRTTREEMVIMGAVKVSSRTVLKCDWMNRDK